MELELVSCNLKNNFFSVFDYFKNLLRIQIRARLKDERFIAKRTAYFK